MTLFNQEIGPTIEEFHDIDMVEVLRTQPFLILGFYVIKTDGSIKILTAKNQRSRCFNRAYVLGPIKKEIEHGTK